MSEASSPTGNVLGLNASQPRLLMLAPGVALYSVSEEIFRLEMLKVWLQFMTSRKPSGCAVQEVLCCCVGRTCKHAV